MEFLLLLLCCCSLICPKHLLLFHPQLQKISSLFLCDQTSQLCQRAESRLNSQQKAFSNQGHLWDERYRNGEGQAKSWSSGEGRVRSEERQLTTMENCDSKPQRLPTEQGNRGRTILFTTYQELSTDNS